MMDMKLDNGWVVKVKSQVEYDFLSWLLEFFGDNFEWENRHYELFSGLFSVYDTSELLYDEDAPEGYYPVIEQFDHIKPVDLLVKYGEGYIFGLDTSDLVILK